MTDKPYLFTEQLAIGADGEAFLDGFFRRWYDITPATDTEQRDGVDRHFINRHTRTHRLIEYKTDRLASKTGNAFLETMSVDRRGKRGWVYTSQADWLMYYVPGGELIYVLNFPHLRRHMPRLEDAYALKSAQNEGYKTWGLIVPLHELERLASLTLTCKGQPA